MKKIMLWKILAAVITALMVFDTLIVVSFASGAAEAVEVPAEIAGISTELGEAYGICPETIQAVCWVESRFQADAVNGGCVGIMQVSEEWHKGRMERLGVTDLKDIRGNMAVGVDYLAELFAEYEDAGAALMKYNGDSRLGALVAGEGDLSEYAREVLTLSAELERRNGK